MTGTTELRDIYEKLTNYVPGSSYVDASCASLELAIYAQEAAYWRVTNGKEPGTAVPFTQAEAFTLPRGEDGYVIPVMPTLEPGLWYEHDISNAMPSSPAAFIDGDTEVEWTSRTNGVEELPIKIKDIDWTNCRRYRKYEPIDEAITGFGIF